MLTGPSFVGLKPSVRDVSVANGALYTGRRPLPGPLPQSAIMEIVVEHPGTGVRCRINVVPEDTVKDVIKKAVDYLGFGEADFINPAAWTLSVEYWCPDTPAQEHGPDQPIEMNAKVKDLAFQTGTFLNLWFDVAKA